MNPSYRFGAHGDGSFQVLWEDGEHVFCRGWRRGTNGDLDALVAVLPASEHPSPASLLALEYSLKDELDGAWAVRPLEFFRDRDWIMLVLDDAGGEPLARLLGGPLEVGSFLRFAIGIATALGQLHRRGLVHNCLLYTSPSPRDS